MELKDILSISGAPGLYKYIAQGKGGIIVESLQDSRRQLVSGAAKVSALGDIAMFTDSEEVPLAQVLQNIYDKNNGGVVAITNKSDNQQLADFMSQALPNYDRERVHISDIKKLAAWYNIMVGAGMTKFVSEEASSEEGGESIAAKVKSESTSSADHVAKKQAAIQAKPKASASQPKVVTPKTTTNRKSS